MASDKDFSEFQEGDFIEIFNPQFKIWVLCEVVTNYGILKQGDEYKWGYTIMVVKEELNDTLKEAYNVYEDRWSITEDMSSKWWREAPPAAKVLYGQR